MKIVYLFAALGLLVICNGCYNPKSDIDAFRPEAEKYLHNLEQIGKTVAAQPPLTQDTISFPDAKRLNFAGKAEDGANAVLIPIEELSDIGEKTKVYERFIDEQYFQPAVSLLLSGKEQYSGMPTRETIKRRFAQLFGIKYLVVARFKKKQVELVNESEYKSGEIRGEAFLCEIGDPTVIHGGVLYVANNSGDLEVRVRGNDARKASDRAIGLNQDLNKQALRALHVKIKQRLPEAIIPSYWTTD